MKKIQFAFYALALCLCFIQCKKTSLSDEGNTINQSQKNNIQNYLTAQKTNNSLKRIEQIEELNKNLLFNESWVEKSYTHSLIVTPINEVYQFSNNKGNKVSNYFVCVMDSNSKIVTSYIVQNKPVNNTSNTDIKKGAIANMDDNKPLAEDCNIRFINMYDYYLYEENYKDNTLVSTRNLSKKPAANTNPTEQNTLTKTSNCTAWYWVTTYPDGSQTWEYLYTICGTCSIPDPINQTILCEGDNGGGEDIGTSATRDVIFVIKEYHQGHDWWILQVSFKLTGVKFNNTANNYFTSVTFNGYIGSGAGGNGLIKPEPAYNGLSNMPLYCYASPATYQRFLTTPSTAYTSASSTITYPNWATSRVENWGNQKLWQASIELY